MSTGNQVAESSAVYFRMPCDAVWMTMVATAVVWGIGLLLLLGLGAARGLLSGTFVIYAVIAFSAYILIDFFLWMKRGIRLVEVDAGGINLYRGKKLLLTRIDGGQITGVNRFDKGGRVIVNVLLGGVVNRGPGVTLFSGPRVRITNDNFNNAQFERFFALLQDFAADGAKKSGEPPPPPGLAVARI